MRAPGMTMPASPAPAPSPSGPGAGFVVPPTGPGRWVVDGAQWATQRPSLLAVAAAGLVAYVAARNLLQVWRHRRHADGARLVTMAPPPEVDPHGAAALWANLAGTLTPSRRRRLLYGSPHVAWQYTWTGRQLLISVWVPGTVPPGAVEAAIRAAWPGAACITDDTATPPIPLDVPAAIGGHLLPTAAEWLALSTDHDNDPLRALMSAGSRLRADEYTCVQVLARPATPRRVLRARRAASRLRDGKTAVPAINPAAPPRWLIELFLTARTGGTSRAAPPAGRRDPGIERDVRAILDKTSHPLWQTAIRYAVAKDTQRSGSSPLERLPRGGRHDRLVVRGLLRPQPPHPPHPHVRAPGSPRRPAPRLRVPDVHTRAGGARGAAPRPRRPRPRPGPREVHAHPRRRPHRQPRHESPRHRRGRRPRRRPVRAGFALSPARDRIHRLGEDTLLVNMAVDDIKAGRGTVVIDPHGDMVLDILDRLPASVADRVVLFDPDQPNPPTLNPLSGDDPDLVVDNLVSIFGNIFAKAHQTLSSPAST